MIAVDDQDRMLDRPERGGVTLSPGPDRCKLSLNGFVAGPAYPSSLEGCAQGSAQARADLRRKLGHLSALHWRRAVCSGSLFDILNPYAVRLAREFPAKIKP